MAGIKTEGNTGNVNETDANGYGYVKTAPLTVPASIGGSIMVSENDAGTATGTPYLYSPETTDDYRLRVGLDTVLDSEVFNYTAQNTGKHYYAFATMTNDLNSNRLRTNVGGVTTINTATVFRTHRYFNFPVGQTSMYGIFNAALDAALTTNTTIDFGFFIHGTTPFAPTDCTYFRITNAGFQGVRCFNGSETVTGVFPFTHAIGTTYQFTVSVTDREVKFWIDDVLYGELDIDATTSTPFSSPALPISIRHAIGGTAAGAALRFLVGGYTVQSGDTGMRSMGEQCASAGGNGSQGQSGATMGSTALFANSSNPTSAAGSNTAVNITGLGGIGAMNAVAGAATDLIATGYQVPAATAAVANKTLVITGIRIAAINMGATVATTPTTLAWFLGVGATAVSLATADTASFATATTKAPRKVPLGLMSAPIGAVVGATYDKDITMSFQSPIYVNPGEWVVTGVRILVGTATASQSIWYTVGFDSHWE